MDSRNDLIIENLLVHFIDIFVLFKSYTTRFALRNHDNKLCQMTKKLSRLKKKIFWLIINSLFHKV